MVLRHVLYFYLGDKRAEFLSTEEQPLRVAARFLKAYSNPFDYQSIKADLRQAANVQASGEALVCKDTLCPFIAYLLWGATVTGEDCPASTELMPHDMGTTKGGECHVSTTEIT